MKLEDLPEYIRQHASYYRGGIKVVFPFGYLKTAKDAKEQLKAKRWIKDNGGYYSGVGFWFIP